MPATPAWTTPLAWTVDQLVSAADMNTYISDNLSVLKGRSDNKQQILRNNSGDYSITSVTTFQDIDGTNLKITIDTYGGPILMYFSGVYYGSTGADNIRLDFLVDSQRIGNAFTAGLALNVGNIALPITVMAIKTGLSAGQHIITPQWRTTTSNTARLKSNSSETPIIFGVMEL